MKRYAIALLDKLSKVTVTSNPLPLVQIANETDFEPEEFDAIAELKLNEKFVASGITVERVS